MISRLAVLLSALSRASPSLVVEATRPLVYLEQPEVLWNSRVGHRLGKDNAVLMAPDGEALYVTSSNGLLVALDPSNGATLGEFEPAPVSDGWTVSCQSGLSVHMDQGEQSYLVYAVIDIPPSGSGGARQSRIFAMNHAIQGNDAALDQPRWISAINGTISGTPVISSDGKYVFATSTVPPSAPTASPTDYPTLSPVISPSGEPSYSPSSFPSSVPTVSSGPTYAPSDVPSTRPSSSPTVIPSSIPSSAPSDVSSALPSMIPSITAVLNTTSSPSLRPSAIASDEPSLWPSINPSSKPSATPSESMFPSNESSLSPSNTRANSTGANSSSTGEPAFRRTEFDERFMLAGEGNAESVGCFFIFSDEDGGAIKFQEASTDVLQVTKHTYGPVAIAHNVTRGKYDGGGDNTNDVVVWGTLPGDDFSDGNVLLFQFPVTFNGQDFDSLFSINLESVAWSTTTAPTITKSGVELFLAASQNKLRGWIGNRDFDLVPNFEATLGTNPSRPNEAPYNSASLSVDEDMLFLGSTQASFYAVSASGNTNIWVDPNLDFTVQAKAQVSPDGLRVYFPSGSKLYSKNAADGSDLWSPPFEHADGASGQINSEFAVSADGLNLYYCSDGARRITGLKLADPPPPTTFPSAVPSGETSAVPSSVPSTSSMPSGSSAPTLSGSPSSTPSVSPSSLPTSTLSTTPSTSSLPSASPSRVIVPPTNRPTPSPTGAPTTDDGVSTGLIIGVSVAGAVVLVGAAYALWRFVLKNGGGGEDGIDPNFVEGGGGGGGGYGSGGGYGDEEDEGPPRRPDYADPATRDWVN